MPPGRACKLTAEQIGHIRDVHRRWHTVRRQRHRICKGWGISADYFNMIGRGLAGKKPRSE